MRHVIAVLLVLSGGASSGAASLADLLAGVAANARFASPARADLRLATGTGETRQAILLGRGDAVYVEVRDGVRALLRPEGVTMAGGGGADRPVAGSDLLLEDLIPFTAATLRFPQISDEGPDGVVVSGAPARASAYTLLVLTVDADRRTVTKTQYYAGTVSNLVKVRRDGGWVRVGGAWRPGETAIEAMHGGSRTTLTLRWREAPDAPARLFEPAGLEGPSGLGWP